MLNRYTNQYTSSISEKGVVDNLIAEIIQFAGLDIVYILRDDGVNDSDIDQLYKENPQVSFHEYYTIEMYLDTPEGFAGQGELFSRFGYEIRDQAILTVSKTRFESVVTSQNASRIRPMEGDLIWIPTTNDIFEIKYTDHRKPQFYEDGSIFKYMLTCDKFEYSSEVFNTNIPEVDSLNYRSQLPAYIPAGDIINPVGEPLAINDMLENNVVDIIINNGQNPYGNV